MNFSRICSALWTPSTSRTGTACRNVLARSLPAVFSRQWSAAVLAPLLLAIPPAGTAFGFDPYDIANGDARNIPEFTYFDATLGCDVGLGIDYLSIHGTSPITGRGSVGYVFAGDPWSDASGTHPSHVNNPLVIRGAVDIYDSGTFQLFTGVDSRGTFTLRSGGRVDLSLSSNASLKVADLRLDSGGELVAGTNVDIFGSLSVSDGGKITLGKNLSLNQITLSGTGAVLESQGYTFTTGELYVQDGKQFDFTAGNQVLDKATVMTGGQLMLNAPLVLTSPMSAINLYGPNALVGSLGSYYSAAQLRLGDGANLVYGGVDSITDSVDIYDVTTLQLQKDLDLRSGYQSGTLVLNGTGATVTDNGHNVLVRNLELPGASRSFNAGDEVTTSVIVSDGGVLTLGADLAVGDSLQFSGTGALITNGHAYAAPRLVIDAGSLAYGSGDSVTDSLTVRNGTFTLEQDLALSGSLSLTGSTALVANGHSYAAPRLSLQGGSLAYGSGDSVTDSLTVRNGTFTLEKDLALAGTLTLTSADALITNGHTFSASNVVLGTAAGFGPGNGGDGIIAMVAAPFFGFPGGGFGGGPVTPTGMSLVYGSRDSITDSVRVYSHSSLTLQRDIALSGGLTISGSQGLVVNGHHYSAATLSIDDGMNLTYGADDLVTQQVVVGNGSTLTLEKDLVLTGGVWLNGTGRIISNGHSYRAPRLDSPLAPSTDLTSISLVSGTDPTATGVSFAAGTVGAFGSSLQLSFTASGSGHYSNILHLQGTDGIAQVLQLTYDPTGLSLDDQQHLMLAWLDGTGHWVNSVLGNHNQPNPILMASPWLGSWASYLATQGGKTVNDLLGAYGVDTATHTVWAAIDHNSQFVVAPVPEPSAVILAGIGAFGATMLMRRRTRCLRRAPKGTASRRTHIHGLLRP